MCFLIYDLIDSSLSVIYTLGTVKPTSKNYFINHLIQISLYLVEWIEQLIFDAHIY